jgi:recombination protein RecT
MSNQEQQQAIKVTKSTVVSDINIGQFLKSKENQIKAALPKHLTSERMLRIATTELRKIPKLRECTVESLFGAIIQSSQLGLEPGSALGQCYLIPFENKKNGVTECQFIIGYQGKIDLARRSGKIISIFARCVYKSDKFKLTFGLDDNIDHEPDFNSERDDVDIIGVYAAAKLKDGGHVFEFLTIKEIKKIRARSKAANNGPWVTDFAEMCKKTAIHRLYKYLPKSIEMADSMRFDDAADDGDQNNGLVFDGEFESLSDTESKQEVVNKSDRIASKISEKDNQSSGVSTKEEVREAAQTANSWISDYDNTPQS